MAFTLAITTDAKAVIKDLKRTNINKHKKVLKTLVLLADNPSHAGLHTHRYTALTGPNGEAVWESYIENNTPAAWRVFWFYGPQQEQITIIAITPHP